VSLWSRSFEVTQNEDKTFVLGYASLPTANDALSTPPLTQATAISFAGCSASFSVYTLPYITGTEIFILTSGASQITFGSTTTSTGIPIGTISIIIPNALTVALTPATYYCDLLVKNGSNNLYYADGPFVIKPSLSR
jgi:hypothetical protein